MGLRDMRLFCLACLLNFIFSNQTNAQFFEEIGETSGIQLLHIDPHVIGGGAGVFDFNNDGLLDIYMTGGDNRDHLYLNSMSGEFSEVGIDAGIAITEDVATVGVAIGDIDNNGYDDILVTTRDNAENILWYNNGDGTVTNIAISAGLVEQAWSTSASFGDYNLDGFLDIYITNYVSYVHTDPILFYTDEMEGQANFMYINNGDKTFSQIADKLGVDDTGAGLAVTFSDLDHDNDLDIYVGNDFPNKFGTSLLFENMYPLDTFRNIAEDSRTDINAFAMGIGIGDYNNDDALDIYVTNIGNNYLLRNNKNGTFTDKAFNSNARCVEPVSWGAFFFDYDNDSHLDLFVATGGMLEDDQNQKQPNHLIKGSPSRLFEEEPEADELRKPSRSRGTAYGDFDNDGNQDIVLVNIDYSNRPADKSTLFRNRGTENHWLGVKLQGIESNRNGYGAKVRVYEGEQFWLQELSGGAGYLSQNSAILHFGLEHRTSIDSIEVTWLGGNKQVLKEVQADQTVTIVEQCYTIETLEATVCAEEGMVIGGKIRTESGTYEEIIDNAEGCDTRRVIELTVNGCVTAIPSVEAQVKVYPNPAIQSFTIEVDGNEAGVSFFSVFNLSGEKVLQGRLNAGKTEVSLKNVSSGTYLVHLGNGQSLRPFKLIKR